MVPMDLVAVDQGAAERFSPDTPLCIGGRPFQTAFPEGSGPYTLGSLVKVKIQNFVSVCHVPSGLHKCSTCPSYTQPHFMQQTLAGYGPFSGCPVINATNWLKLTPHAGTQVSVACSCFE